MGYDTTPGETTDWQQVHQTKYDPDSYHDLATTIVLAIAAVENVTPTDLQSPPLYDVLDVAALERSLFGRDSKNVAQDREGEVTFVYDDYRITVRSDGWIFIAE